MSHTRSSSAPRAPASHCRHLPRSAILCAATLILAGCEMRAPGGSLWGGESHKLGPRIVQLGEPVPKGGGVYKVGAPYRLNGVVYEPREVDRYDRTGIASWYGEMFHGRRTANGEIYDMEALTAAHPTLPLPSYARVTNLENGRSLVVRINDRGPYARGRLIDLSWAVASLLQIHNLGTAPVRVQYLGPAPLSGNDGYERQMLARQRWAGPRVAYARSPGKAIRYHQASAGLAAPAVATAANLDLGAAGPSQSAPMRTAKVRTAQAAAPAPLPSTPPLPAKTAAHREPRPQPKTPIKVQTKIQANAAPATKSASEPRQPPQAQSTAAGEANVKQAANIAAAYYVEAGLFNRKATADELAAILAEIAPASVEPVTIGERSVHRIRLGPFAQDQAAQAAVERIRAAGLTGAHVEDSHGS